MRFFAVSRYIKKLNPFVEQLENILDNTRLYLGELLMFTESMQARIYIRLTESLEFKSTATQFLSRFIENTDADVKILKRVKKRQSDIEKAIQGLKGREWDGKTNLQQVYAQIQDQMKWILDLLEFLKKDTTTVRKLNNQQELALIQQCINDNGDYLEDLYQYYAQCLQHLEQLLEDRLAGGT